MKIESMYHRAMSNYAFVVKRNEIYIRFRTAKNDIQHVILHYGVKFDWGNQWTVEMERIHSDDYFDYYQSDIIIDDMRLCYYFEVNDGVESIFYTEAGVFNDLNENIIDGYTYQFPSVHEEDLVESPEWYRDANFYQIFVDRFSNGDSSISPQGTVNWNSKPELHSFYGGDLIGVMNHLDYLQELGITAIYLTPIFCGNSNHKYDIFDYMNIDEHFGSNEQFKALVQKAHEKGIHIILDAVFNHCSEKFKAFADVMKNQEQSEYKHWFRIRSFPIVQHPASYDTFGMYGYLPKLDTDEVDVQNYLLSVVKYWTEEYHIDGWRLDVSDELSHDFLRRFRKLVKGISNDLVIIGENWHDSNAWLLGDQFDTVMNYGFTYRCVNYFAKHKMTAKEFSNSMVTWLMNYSDQLNKSMLNFLDTHDTERFRYLANEEEESLKNALAFLYGYVGVPCIFYGTELGLSGGLDPACRPPFPWDESRWNKSLLNYVKRLISIRKEEIALRKGNISFMSTDELVIVKRSYEGETIYLIINETNQEQVIPEDIFNEVTEELLHNAAVGSGIAKQTSWILK